MTGMVYVRTSFASWLVCLLCGGCAGGDATPRFEVTGSVTYDGKPVPAGKVYFTPDAGKQNLGPVAEGDIQDGHYDTRKGRGTLGGPVVVRIDGYDGKRTAERPMGAPVFTYETKTDLPRESTTKDFAVSAAEAKKITVPSGPSP
jgi:hypothetical protein